MTKENNTQPQLPGSSEEQRAESRRIKIIKKLDCGSCEGLVRNAVLDQRCNEVGRLPSSKACTSHKPDVFTLATGEEKEGILDSIAEAMSRMGGNDLQIMASLMMGEKTTRKYGYRFHQKVYIRVRGETTANYMGNFAVGYVLSADKDSVRVIGESGSMSVTFINDKESLTLYTVERFNKLRLHMLNNKQYRDPNMETRIVQLHPERAEDSVRTFDEAVSDGLIDKKKKSERGDLVSLVARLTKGHLRTPKSDRRKTDRRLPEDQGSGSSVKFKSF